MSTSRRTTVQDLITAGAIDPSADLFHVYRGTTLQAKVTETGAIQVGDEVHDSLTAAALAAISQCRDDGAAKNVNGWQFWKTKGEMGRATSLSQLRKSLADSPPESRLHSD